MTEITFPKEYDFPTLVHLLKNRVEQSPNSPLYTFLEDGEEAAVHWSRQDLWQRAQAIAAQLQQQGLKAERAVLLYAPSLDYIAGFFGCLLAGVVAVPAYPPDPTRLEKTLPRLQSIIKASQAKVILTTEMIQSMSQMFAGLAPDLVKMPWISTDQLALDLAQNWEDPKALSENLAFLQYTSGSTGDPKGVMLTHANLLANMELIRRGFGIGPKDTGVSWLPPYHDMGLIGKILETVYMGTNITLMSPLHFLQKPMRWLQAISRSKATVSGGPNFAYEMCARKATPEQIEALDLSRWQIAFNGAEPILPETVERFSRTFAPCGFKQEAFYPCYGLAEATLMVSGSSRGRGVKSLSLPKSEFRQKQMVASIEGEDDILKLIGCGTNFEPQQTVIARPDTMTVCPENEVGEIWVQGPSIAQGYFNQPELSQQTFQAYLKDTGEGPFLRTGDLGFLKDGELFVTGRLKDLIIIRGENHYPQDIERTVESAHPAIRSGCSAAFSIKMAYEEKLAVVMEVETKKLGEETPAYQNLVQALTEAIAKEHAVEASVLVMLKKNDLPKTSSGKVRRSATREDYINKRLELLYEHRVALPASSDGAKQDKALNQVASSEQAHDPHSVEGIQAWLVERLSEHIGVNTSEIDVEKNLAAYGLDSKDAVNLSGELEDWLGRQLSPTVLWKYPTVKSLAEYLISEDDVDPAANIA